MSETGDARSAGKPRRAGTSAKDASPRPSDDRSIAGTLFLVAALCSVLVALSMGAMNDLGPIEALPALDKGYAPETDPWTTALFAVMVLATLAIYVRAYVLHKEVRAVTHSFVLPVGVFVAALGIVSSFVDTGDLSDTTPREPRLVVDEPKLDVEKGSPDAPRAVLPSVENALDVKGVADLLLPWLVVGAALLSVAGVIRYSLRKSAEPVGVREARAFAEGAESAMAILDDWSSYGDGSRAIIAAWDSFQDVARETLGIGREKSETAREFGRDLVRAGLRNDALDALTGLFERARYSSATAGTAEVAAAREAFGILSAACRDAAARKAPSAAVPSLRAGGVADVGDPGGAGDGRLPC